MDWVAVALEEYKSLRQETLAAVERQHSILRFGFAGVGALIGFGTQILDDKLLAALLFLLLTPTAIVFIVVLWLGEIERMERAGAYIAGLERIVSRCFPNSDVGPLRWETWLREEGQRASPRLSGSHLAYFALFGLLGGTSLAIGFSVLVSERVSVIYFLPFAVCDALLLWGLVHWQKKHPPLEAWE